VSYFSPRLMCSSCGGDLPPTSDAIKAMEEHLRMVPIAYGRGVSIITASRMMISAEVLKQRKGFGFVILKRYRATRRRAALLLSKP